MKKQTYERWRRILTSLVAVGVGLAAVRGMIWFAVISVLMGLVILWALKQQTREVIEDERTRMV